MSMNREPTPEEWEAYAAFKMPEVNEMDPVVWYNAGDLTSAAKFGFAIKVEDRTIIVMKQTIDEFNRITESCRHKDDPALNIFPNLRSKGVWDFHPSFKKLRARLQSIEDRLNGATAGTATKTPAEIAAEEKSEADRKAAVDANKEVTAVKEQEIVNLHAEGRKPGEIAEILGAGWTAPKVGIVLKKTQLKPELAEVS